VAHRYRLPSVHGYYPDLLGAYMTVLIVCRYCSKEFPVKPSQVDKRVYCSKSCEAEDYKIRMKGKNNPNYKRAGWRICEGCRQEFHNYDKRKKFCSVDCYNNSEQKREHARRANDGNRKPPGNCKKCGKEISHKRVYCNDHNPNIKRKYGICRNCGQRVDRYNGVDFCPQCRIEKGYALKGAKPKKYKSFCSECGTGINKWNRKYCDSCWRGYMSSRRGLLWRKDQNQDLIVDALKKAGCSVLDLSMVGGGCPDLMVGKNKINYFMEVKNPETKGELNEMQKRFIEEWDAPIHVVRTPEEALRIIGMYD
jgi:hypothetical protein